jgi:hypothetical protein
VQEIPEKPNASGSAIRAEQKPYSAIDQSNKYWTAREEITTLDAEQADAKQRVRPSAFLNSACLGLATKKPLSLKKTSNGNL